MKLRKLSLFIVPLLLVFLVTGCSDDEKTTDEFEGPEWTVDPVEVPENMAQSDDPFAQMAVGYVDLANGFSAYGGFFAPPARALCSVNRDGEWEYTWSDGSLTVTLIITETSDYYYWKIYFDGTDGTTTFDNFLFIEAEQTIDGSSGSLYIYDPGQTGYAFMWSWEIDADGAYHFTCEFFEDFKIEVVINADGSGSVEFYDYGTAGYWRNFRIEWTAEGSGEWWEYDEAGNEIAHGTWT